jgi:hypothetical protein
MTQTSIKLAIKGLYTTPSDLSAVPPGAMEIADNINVDQEDLAKPRRGLDDYGASFGTGTSRANKIFTFGSYVIVHHGTNLSYSAGENQAFTQYSGSYAAPSATRTMTAAQANKNFYFTTATGVKKIDSISLEPKDVGAPKAIHFETQLSAGTGGFLQASESVNYRVVWGYRDQNGNLILGAPSQIVTVTNGPSAKNVDFKIYIPQGISTSHFVQIYRSFATSSGSPSLELAQVFEKSPSAAEIAAGVMGDFVSPTITDVADDSIRGALLYTSPSLGGTVVSNDLPPLARVIGRYKSYLMYCNTVSKYRLTITLLGTGSSSSSLQGGDTIKIGSRTYTGAATEASMQFKVVGGAGGATTTGFPSEDIRQTCESLVKTINQDSSSPVYAFYISDSSTMPGKILLEERGIGSTTGFGVWVSRSGPFSPTTLSQTQTVSLATGTNLVTFTANPPVNNDTVIFTSVTAGGVSTLTIYYVINQSGLTCQLSTSPGGSPLTITSNGSGNIQRPVSASNETALNRVYFSKPEEPEAVPLLNYREIGSADKAILAALQLRESFIILKEDGCYRISQEAPFQVDLIDSTQALIGPDSAVVLNNAIYALTTQGIINITEGGASVIALPIEEDILELFGAAIDAIKLYSFAVAYETDRRYILFLPETSSDTFATQAIAYNTFTRAWTRWTLRKRCGLVNPNTDKLMLGSSTLNRLDVERKRFDFTDYVDFSSNQTISAQNSNTLTITGTDTMAVGDLIYQNTTTYSFVTALDTANNTATVLDPVTFSLGAVKVYSSIPVRVRWTIEVAGAPANLKHFSEVVLYFKQFFPGSAYLKFTSDRSPGEVFVTLQGNSESSGWGLFGWGDDSWGGINYRKPLRALVPRQHERCSQLSIEFTHGFAYGDFELQGLSVNYNPGSSRV